MPAGPPVPLAAAVAAGVRVARWWLARTGATWAAAAAAGLAVGLVGAVGGPAARAAVAVPAGVADLLAATDGGP